MPGVYISYPFCRQKCTFCNFASGVFPQSLAAEYLAALGEEIRTHRWDWLPETLYVGGGSPSEMKPEQLERILEAVPGRPWLEATIEAPPGSITLEKASAWRRLGINRVSLGVQSFVTRELASTGRRHNATIVSEEIDCLRRAGIDNFNLDLIAGMPGQTRSSWRESLDWVERLQAPHVSVYMLEIDSDSRLGAEILAGGRRYRAAEVPPEELIVELYQDAVERLEKMGLARYEISNFARPGMESRHNLKYWRGEPYVGFGADAHSFDGRLRSRNAETPQEYIERRRKGQLFCVERTPAKPKEERFILGLRLLEGIEPSPGDWEKFHGVIQQYIHAGLLEADGGRLRLTPRGIILSTEVLQEFIHD